MASITIVKAGIYSTIQDEGRNGYAHIGVPQSGAIDKKAMRLANTLLNNPSHTAVLEYTLIGPVIQFNTTSFFVLSGGTVHAQLEEQDINPYQVYKATAGQLLKIGSIHNGSRGYLAISGGIRTAEYLGSRSFFYPVSPFEKLKAGDVLPIGDTTYNDTIGSRINAKQFTHITNQETVAIEVYPAPEFKKLNATQRKKLESQTFTLSKYWNRMAIQLQEAINNTIPSIPTGPVLPGIIQLTPAGTLIILMADCQVTGGYPRIMQLSDSGMECISQLKQGDTIKFKLVGL